jgi:ATP-binding cassette, subfamily C (CFTR/MRP), member 2
MCAYGDGACGFMGILDSSTCINHITVLSISAILTVFLLINLILRITKTNVPVRKVLGLSSPLHLLSTAFNGGLALAYLSLSAYMLIENFTKSYITYYAPHWWLSVLSLGFYQLLLCMFFTCRNRYLKICLVLPTIFAGFLCCSSIGYLLKGKKLNIDALLDILSLPGALLWIVCAFYIPRDEEEIINENLYKPLNTDISPVQLDEKLKVENLSTAGFFSIMSFWWLNPLMKKGYEKPLEEKDIPELGEIDRAGTQYTIFLDKLIHQKQKGKQNSSPSFFWTIVSCHKRDIFISGFFALLKVFTLSSGPMILNAFIKVSLGQEAFKYEGYVLAVGLFFAKCTESLSQRQWYFRSRRLGLQVRSLLSAAIYKKQQRLSNLAKLTHSSGEIMNYMTVGAYRIGEFPYWFHQTWTTSLQLCIALAILYKAVGLATISSMVVIILTVACNAPLANLQHKFQTRMMEAQDERLKAMSESLANMKVLKLYAWERHFWKVIEKLRQKEYVWIRAFQLRKAYNIFLFWTTPVLVSAATFLSCYLLGVPLEPSNVFTFVATLRLVQDPVRQIPDVIGVVIQAKVAFERVVKFLEAPELPTEKVRKEAFASVEELIVMESCDFSWDENLSRPTLRNVNLVVRSGEKVAICGEVGSGKSTLLAAVLGEVPKTCGMV